MARREYTEEEIIVAMEVLTYMSENNVSLEKAYEDKMVSEEMKLSKEEIETIKNQFLA